jgi:type VI secretion system secreted protein Hcp
MAIDIFLKLTGIEGESTDDKHRSEIDILGWSWGLSEPAPASGGGGAGKVAIRNITIQKLADLSSPLLLQSSATGARIASAIVTARRAGAAAAEFLIFTMTDVIVTSVEVIANASAGNPSESVTLRFSKVEFDYRSTLPSGGLGPEKSFRWDIPTNRPF